MSLSYGDIDLDLSFDWQTRLAKIQGRELALKDANVVMVDGVGSPEGPKVAETMYVDAGVLETPFRIQSVLRKSPKVVSYLRCDAQLPDSRMQQMMAILCGMVTAK